MSQRWVRWVLVGVGSLVLGLLVPRFAAQEPLKPGRLSKEEAAALQPGLTLRFYAERAAAKSLDCRRTRLPALHLPAGSPPTPLLPPGPVHAAWTGYLKAPLKGEYRFRTAGTTGTAVLTINAGVVPWGAGTPEDQEGKVDLVRGYNRFELRYTGPERGDTTLRLHWMGEGFPWEPVPPELFFSRGDDPDVQKGQRLRAGRVLYATLGCTNCHALPGRHEPGPGSMPELEYRAPSLLGAGQRFQPAWLTRWIAEPRSLRANATMPQVLQGTPAAVHQQAADIAAYLQTLELPPGAGAPVPPGKDREALVQEGQRRFEKLGCLGCHHLKDAAQPDMFDRLSLYFVTAKFQPGRLEAFLRRPHEYYPWSRMPDFHLTGDEAAGLAAFLTSQATGTVDAPAPAQPASAERGGKLFASAGCQQCHPLKAGEPVAVARRPPPQPKSEGCLAEQGSNPAPRFGLTADQRRALLDFLSTDGNSVLRDTAVEFSARQVQALQCQVCHPRDGQSSRLWDVLAEEGDGTVPPNAPALSWTGAKLRTAWTVRLLAGEHGHRARPWLTLRMPAFPKHAEWLATGLSHEHGYSATEDARPARDANLAALGAKLIENVGGFNCISCHGIGQRPPVAPFEAPGINLLDAVQRLRYDYYPRWMIDPTRVDSATKMPKFAQDGKTTPLKDVLDGNAHRQFEAIWHYMATLPETAAK